MTKKDIQLIAETIKDINERKAKGYRIADIFAKALSKQKAGFNRLGFLVECGIYTEDIGENEDGTKNYTYSIND